MYDHISSVWRWVYLQLCRFGCIRAFLIVDTDAQLARSRIFSRIDYCSSLLVSITSERIARLQNILLTFRNKRHDYVTPLLKKLHWLPVSERIVFNLATLEDNSAILTAHYHLTSPALCRQTHSPDLFSLPLKIF